MTRLKRKKKVEQKRKLKIKKRDAGVAKFCAPPFFLFFFNCVTFFFVTCCMNLDFKYFLFYYFV